MALVITITNDGEGSEGWANYDVRVCVNREELTSFTLLNHRRADGWKPLLLRAAQAAQGDFCSICRRRHGPEVEHACE